MGLDSVAYFILVLISMKKWVVAAKRADFARIGEKFNIDQVVARIIRNRDIIEYDDIDEYLNADLSSLYDPTLMADMFIAIDIIKEKISDNKKIRVIGDYDIDGVCSSYILKDALGSLGACVSVEIPHRIVDGYGINESIVERAREDGVDTIITCDNGIAAFDAIRLAKQSGMDVIVTDHHEIPYDLDEAGNKRFRFVDADAIINPKREDCPYPFKGLCGAVVALKLITALFDDYKEEDPVGYRNLDTEKYLEIAAIATVGDVMELKGENRTIVKEGLKRLNHTKNVGLKALITKKKIRFGEIKAYHIGFVIGPCLNASGRLDTAKRALQLLEQTDESKAALIADELDSLNEQRKELTQRGVDEAVGMIENGELKNDRVLVVYLPWIHESVAGIIAGRIREKYNKPVFVLAERSVSKGPDAR